MPQQKTPEETSEQIAKQFFGVDPDPASRRSAIRRLLVSAVLCAVLIPVLFLLRFGEVGGLGWGLTVFFVVYCLLEAIGLYFQPRREYHTPVPLRGDWLDRLGAFWLVSCAFGPFFGWLLTSALPITTATWRWLYGGRVFLAAGLPVLTALPLARYLRGKAIWVALPLLVGITMLAVWSTVHASQDLLAGPILRQAPSTGQMEMFLRYTGVSLSISGG